MQKQYYNLFRLPNLLIVGATQYLLAGQLLYTPMRNAGYTPVLDHFHFFLLVLDTILITAAGYVINAIYDTDIDRINKKEKHRLTDEQKDKAYIMYGVLTVFGAIITAYLAWYIRQPTWFFIYPVATLLLWMYSRSWKRMVLIGNVVVALFCACAPGIVLLFESQNIIFASYSFIMFASYMAFAFITTLYREIIKDMEDIEGDRLENCRTLPIVYGMRNAKWLAAICNIVLLVCLIYSACYITTMQNGTLFHIVFLVLGIIAPLVLSLVFLYQAKQRKDFSRISRLIKWIMVAGLIFVMM